MTFRIAGLDEIKRWALSFGPEANFLKPEKPEDFDLGIVFCYDAVNFGFSPPTFSLDQNPGCQSKKGNKNAR
jgi:hypothetical protein